MKTIKVAEATGAALNWLVAKCEGLDIDSLEAGNVWVWETDPLTGERERVVLFRPTRNWAQGGPIIEREAHNLFKHNGGTEWCCACYVQRDGYVAIVTADGPTPLTAAMRCYIASKLGDEVEMPNETVQIIDDGVLARRLT